MTDKPITRDDIALNVTTNVHLWKDGKVDVSIVLDSDAHLDADTLQNIASTTATIITGKVHTSLVLSDSSTVHGTHVHRFTEGSN